MRSIAVKEGGGPAPDVRNNTPLQLNQQLSEPTTSHTHDEVTMFDRDHAVHILRFLKVWFEMPSDVFIAAAALLDRFLHVMRVKRKFLACLMVSCFNVAAQMHQHHVDARNLVRHSQSRCSVRDMQRMSALITQKLSLADADPPITVHDYLAQLFACVETVAAKMNIWPLFGRIINRETLLRNVEIVVCNGRCAALKPTVIALVLMEEELLAFAGSDIPLETFHYSYQLLRLFTSIVDLQLVPKMPPEEYYSSQTLIAECLSDYRNYSKSTHQQHLQWRYCSRALYRTRPMWRNFAKYQAIAEE